MWIIGRSMFKSWFSMHRLKQQRGKRSHQIHSHVTFSSFRFREHLFLLYNIVDIQFSPLSISQNLMRRSYFSAPVSFSISRFSFTFASKSSFAASVSPVSAEIFALPHRRLRRKPPVLSAAGCPHPSGSRSLTSDPQRVRLSHPARCRVCGCTHRTGCIVVCRCEFQAAAVREVKHSLGDSFSEGLLSDDRCPVVIL